MPERVNLGNGLHIVDKSGKNVEIVSENKLENMVKNVKSGDFDNTSTLAAYEGGAVEDSYMKMSPKKQDKFWGYMTLVGGCSIHLFGGILFLWGNIANYVVSYFHYKGDPNATLMAAMAIMPI